MFGARHPTPEELQMAKEYLESTHEDLVQRRQERMELQAAVEQHQGRVSEIIDPVRERLTSQADAGTGGRPAPKPIACWEFDDDLQDSIGTNHGRAHAGAYIEAGALVLESGGYATTAPLTRNLKEKTLEAWVSLSDLNQRGGGVMSVQTSNGVLFDSIVFGEREPRRWLAGSNNFRRTEPFGGPAENEAETRSVHVAIAYHSDGRIAGFRQGKPYGKDYISDGPLEFREGNVIVSFGVRHLPAGGNRMLHGRIDRARLYDRALTAEEIEATFKDAGHIVTQSDVMAALSEQDRREVESARRRIAGLQTRLSSLGPVSKESDESAIWTDLVQAMLVLTEFIYVR